MRPIMREVHRSQFQLGQVPVEKVWINPKSRDDIPAVLKGLQLFSASWRAAGPSGPEHAVEIQNNGVFTLRIGGLS